MGDQHESLAGMLKGITVDPKDLHGAAEWLQAIQDHWDEAILGSVRHTITPLHDGTKSAGAHHVKGWANAYGRFDEADNVKRSAGDGHEALVARVRDIGKLLLELQEVTGRIAANYEATELDNAAEQKGLIAQLDTAMSAGKTGPGGPGAIV